MATHWVFKAFLVQALVHQIIGLVPSFLGKPGPSSQAQTQTSSAWNPRQTIDSMFHTVPQALAVSTTLPELPLRAPPVPNLNTLFRPRQVEEPEIRDKSGPRQQMQDDADISSKLALQLYFQAHQNDDAPRKEMPVRLSRSCPTGAEVYRKSFGGNDCVICKGDVCELAEHADSHPEFRGPPSMTGMVFDLLSSGPRTLAGFTGREEEMKKTEIDQVPVEVLWHESLSRTLHVLGIANRMDSTMHEGVHYMDIVIERGSNPHLRWGEGKGAVLQLLTANTLRGETETNQYVKLKTRAIEKGGWTPLSVPWYEWSALSCDVDRISWLAVKLASLGLFERVA